MLSTSSTLLPNRLPNRRPIFDIVSTSPESFGAAERTLLRARLDRAKTRLVAFQRGSLAVELSPEAAAKLLDLDESSAANTPISDVHGLEDKSPPPTATETGEGPKSWETVASMSQRSSPKQDCVGWTDSMDVVVEKIEEENEEEEDGFLTMTEDGDGDAGSSTFQPSTSPLPPPPPPCTPATPPNLPPRRKGPTLTVFPTPSKRVSGFSLPSIPTQRPAPLLRSHSNPTPGALATMLSRSNSLGPKPEGDTTASRVATTETLGLSATASVDPLGEGHNRYPTWNDNALTTAIARDKLKEKSKRVLPELVLSSETTPPRPPQSSPNKDYHSSESAPSSIRRVQKSSSPQVDVETSATLTAVNSPPPSDSSCSSRCSDSCSRPTTAGSASSFPTATSSSSSKAAPLTPHGKAPPVALPSTGRSPLGLELPTPPEAPHTTISAILGELFAPTASFSSTQRHFQLPQPTPRQVRRLSTSPPTPRYRVRPNSPSPSASNVRQSIMDPSLSADSLTLPFTRRNSMRRQSSVGEAYFPNSANLCLSGWEREKRRRKDVALGLANPKKAWESSSGKIENQFPVTSKSRRSLRRTESEGAGYAGDVEEDDDDDDDHQEYYRFEPSVFASAHSNSATSLSSASSARVSRGPAPPTSFNSSTRRRTASSSAGSNFTSSPYSSPSASLTTSPVPPFLSKLDANIDGDQDSGDRRRNFRKEQESRRRTMEMEEGASFTIDDGGSSLAQGPSQRKRFFFI